VPKRIRREIAQARYRRRISAPVTRERDVNGGPRTSVCMCFAKPISKKTVFLMEVKGETGSTVVVR